MPSTPIYQPWLEGDDEWEPEAPYDSHSSLVVARNLDLPKVRWEQLQLGDDGIAYLAKYRLPTNRPHTLYLYRNGIGDKGAVSLAGMLRSPELQRSLERCNLNDNPIGTAGAAALGEALCEPLSKLSKLYMGGCRVQDAGAAALGRAIARNPRSLTKLSLYNNQIGDAGAEALGLSLADNTHLEKLFLGGNPHIGAKGVRGIARGLARNVTLRELYIVGAGDDRNALRAIFESLVFEPLRRQHRFVREMWLLARRGADEPRNNGGGERDEEFVRAFRFVLDVFVRAGGGESDHQSWFKLLLDYLFGTKARGFTPTIVV